MSEQEHLLYRLGDLTYAMPIERVESIERLAPITPVPLQPQEQLGVAAVRGALYAVFDTARMMAVEGGSYTGEDMLILIEGKRAFRVSEASEIVKVDRAEVQESLGTRIWLRNEKAVPIQDLSELGKGCGVEDVNNDID